MLSAGVYPACSSGEAFPHEVSRFSPQREPSHTGVIYLLVPHNKAFPCQTSSGSALEATDDVAKIIALNCTGYIVDKGDASVALYLLLDRAVLRDVNCDEDPGDGGTLGRPVVTSPFLSMVARLSLGVIILAAGCCSRLGVGFKQGM